MSSSVVIHWCSLVETQTPFVHSALEELRQKLSSSYPELPHVSVSQLPPGEIAELPRFLNLEMVGNPAVGAQADSLRNKLLFVYCNCDEEFVKKAMEQNGLAEWGASLLGSYALAWVPNKFLVWHEALHLLNADDCYDPKTEETICTEPHCIMQYAPTDENCAGDLRVCAANLRRVRDFL